MSEAVISRFWTTLGRLESAIAYTKDKMAKTKFGYDDPRKEAFDVSLRNMKELRGQMSTIAKKVNSGNFSSSEEQRIRNICDRVDSLLGIPLAQSNDAPDLSSAPSAPVAPVAPGLYHGYNPLTGEELLDDEPVELQQADIPEIPQQEECGICRVKTLTPSNTYTGPCGHKVCKTCHTAIRMTVPIGKKPCPFCRMVGFGRKRR